MVKPLKKKILTGSVKKVGSQPSDRLDIYAPRRTFNHITRLYG